MSASYPYTTRTSHAGFTRPWHLVVLLAALFSVVVFMLATRAVRGNLLMGLIVLAAVPVALTWRGLRFLRQSPADEAATFVYRLLVSLVLGTYAGLLVVIGNL